MYPYTVELKWEKRDVLGDFIYPKIKFRSRFSLDIIYDQCKHFIPLFSSLQGDSNNLSHTNVEPKMFFIKILILSDRLSAAFAKFGIQTFKFSNIYYPM